MNGISYERYLGDGPGHYRIGVLALANDQVIERDFARMLPPEVLTYTTRIAFAGDCNPENLAGLAPLLADATSLLNPEVSLDAVVFGCTSGTIAIGSERVRGLIQRASPNVMVVNPVDAACDAFDRLGVQRLNLVTPYEPELADLVARTLSQKGWEIASRFDFGITDSADISRVTPQAILKAAAGLPYAGSDATFICCTDFQSLHVLEDIEVATGLPAVSSNQAIVAALLHRFGLPADRRGFGQLLNRDLDHSTGKRQQGKGKKCH